MFWNDLDVSRSNNTTFSGFSSHPISMPGAGFRLSCGGIGHPVGPRRRAQLRKKIARDLADLGIRFIAENSSTKHNNFYQTIS